jgi:hypothetical protein
LSSASVKRGSETGVRGGKKARKDGRRLTGKRIVILEDLAEMEDAEVRGRWGPVVLPF